MSPVGLLISRVAVLSIRCGVTLMCKGCPGLCVSIITSPLTDWCESMPLAELLLNWFMLLFALFKLFRLLTRELLLFMTSALWFGSSYSSFRFSLCSL